MYRLSAMVIALQAKSNTLQTQSASFEKALKAEQAKVSALDQHIVTLEQQLARYDGHATAEAQNNWMRTSISWS